MRRELHPHQHRALDLLRASIRTGHKRPMVMSPTGSGKTILAAAIVEGARAKGNRVVFTVPAISLIDQTVQRFVEEGFDPNHIGIIQADHPGRNKHAPIQIASVQTLARRALPETDIVVVDEAHIAHKAIFGWMNVCPDLLFVGLSATPWTRGLGRYYDDLVIGSTTADLIAASYLSPFRVFAPSHPDLSGVSTVAGDYHEGELAEAVNKPAIVADVVKTWLDLGEDRPTLVFGVNRAHAKSLQERFEAAGVVTAYIDSYTTREERQAIGEHFASGAIRVVCNVGVLTTGIDWDVRCLVLARPTKSAMLYTQIVGRALRTAPDKQDALILDHSDSTLNLGLVTDISQNSLDDGKMGKSRSRPSEAKAQTMPKECAKCHFVKPAGIHKCPSCGFAPVRDPKVDVLDGQLKLVAGKKLKADRDTKQRWYSGLLWYCEDRGYRPGWAANKFKEKFGVWPRGLGEYSLPPIGEVRNFVTSRAIAYRKGQSKAGHHAA